MTERVALSVEEVAAALGVSRRTIYRAVAAGEIPSFKVGGRILIRQSWLDSLTAESAAVAS